MEQRPNYAAEKDAQIKLSNKECASSMGRRRSANDVATKDVQIKPEKEEYASGMGQKGNDAAGKGLK